MVQSDPQSQHPKVLQVWSQMPAGECSQHLPAWLPAREGVMTLMLRRNLTTACTSVRCSQDSQGNCWGHCATSLTPSPRPSVCDILARLPLSDPIGQADEYAMPGTSGGDRWLLWAPWGVPSWAARGHFKRGAGALQSLLRINRVYGGRVHYTEEATPDPVSIMPGAEGEVVGSWRCLETQVEAREWRVPQRPKQP